MKYLKLFEELKNIPRPAGWELPQVDDYIICREDTSTKDDIKDFIHNNVGQIVSKEPTDALYISYLYVTYDNIPQEFKVRGIFAQKNYQYVRLFSKEEIVFFSSNKEDCEVYLAMNKYNL